MMPQASAAPVQRNENTMPKCSVEKRADRAAPAERDQQQIAGHHRRQHQRQVHHAVEQRLAPEILARQQPGDRNAERQRHHRRHDRDAQREMDRGPFVWGEIKHRDKPCPGRGAPRAKRGGVQLTRDRYEAGVWNGPGSAAHHCSASKTRVNALVVLHRVRDAPPATNSRRRPDQEREAVGLEHRLRRLRAQECEIARRVRLGGLGQRHRIDDGGMRVRPGRCRPSFTFGSTLASVE